MPFRNESQSSLELSRAFVARLSLNSIDVITSLPESLREPRPPAYCKEVSSLAQANNNPNQERNIAHDRALPTQHPPPSTQSTFATIERQSTSTPIGYSRHKQHPLRQSTPDTINTLHHRALPTQATSTTIEHFQPKQHPPPSRTPDTSTP
jgi:hypothetical protein